MGSEFFIARRRVLRQLATTIGAAAISSSAYPSRNPTCGISDTNLAVTIDALILDQASAAIIGEAYLAQHNEERSADLLSRKIRESLGAKTGEIDQQALLNQIRVDFERTDIINLHGWLLSRTEARLCALCTF